ncbi:MAG: di-trans,poly-cis-decaprenylcistransferase [Candidatus Levybacteria bacterium]|nr:di-trans,poly-cis-decaprenylcistransferase [Candidatus Levybacteria bacterium]
MPKKDESILLPKHIAIIPDGNRRWAKEHSLPSLQGHRKGFQVAQVLARKIRASGVPTLTFWAFSTENWKRDGKEVGYLMQFYSKFLEKNLLSMDDEKVRYIHLGRKDRIPEKLLAKIENIEEKTKKFKKYYLNFALDYGGHDEIVRAVKKIVGKGVKSDDITESLIEANLDTAQEPYPNPDLVIRTSGENRTSGFMPWQAAYAEYIFIDKYFPDLTEGDIDWALAEYSRRQRRFGK